MLQRFGEIAALVENIGDATDIPAAKLWPVSAEHDHHATGQNAVPVVTHASTMAMAPELRTA